MMSGDRVDAVPLSEANGLDRWGPRPGEGPLRPGGEPFFFPGGPIGVLLIHGFTGAPQEMRRLGMFLADRGRTVLGIRLPGHGTRPEDLGAVTWRDWAEAVAAGARTLRERCEHVFLCGLSLGGVLAIYEAARQPPDGLIVMASPYRIRDIRLRFLWLLKWLIPYVGKSPSDPRDPAAQAERISYPWYPLAAVEEVVRAVQAAAARLPQVRCPALLVYSRADRTVPPDQGWAMYHRLGSHDKTIHWLVHSGHVIPEDIEREEVFEQIERFIRRVVAQKARGIAEH
ncbi:Thermostable monoacylglycerol lipase [Candidatus Thermoflexus japonica]|uniref:Thermostable monoacylglycerol lipase n=1 Tax=Candidatus Thermoflexus japonica TaxID=2035417 RepID=A0A2H5Y2X5_9CHLR|nr:Thermostable monoacylglycerol lipase [Candidatus Thermoflexus japonica]